MMTIGRVTIDRVTNGGARSYIVHGFGVTGHIRPKCRSKHKWASYEQSNCDANPASTPSTSAAESDTFFFSVIQSDPIPDSMPDSVITVNVAAANQSADYWILDPGVTNHVTANRHLFQTFHPLAKGENQVKRANNSFGNAEHSATITFSVGKPIAQHAKIVMQHVLYVPASGMNNLISIIHLMRKVVTFNLKLNGAMSSFGLVLVDDAPLFNSLFMLNASAALFIKA